MKPAIAPTALTLFLLTSITTSHAFDIPRAIDGPVTITESGSYVVTQDFSVAVPPAITIAAPNVTLDLNGKTISTPVIDPDIDNSPLVVMNPGARQLLIRNGKLQGGSHCILGAAKDLRLSMDHVDCAQAKYGIDIDSATNIAITDSSISVLRAAVGIGGAYPLTFERNHVSTGFYYVGGITFDGVAFGSVSGNTISVESYQGLLLWMNGSGMVRITNNVFHGHDTPHGLDLHSGQYVVANNTIDGSRIGAINVESSGNLIVNNRLTHAGGLCTGISVAGSDNTVSGNAVTDYMWGIQVRGTRNTISGNTLRDNWEGGIQVDGTSHRIVGNTAHSTKASRWLV